jgi:phage-related tail fiber protein
MALNLAGDGYITGLGSNQAEYGMPAGSVIHVAMDTAPNGYLKANGAAISRTTYDKLFAAIGITYGAGDGSTTFNLPDLRGEFIRCWDDSKGVDAGRAIGSSQIGTLSGGDFDGLSTQTAGSVGPTNPNSGRAWTGLDNINPASYPNTYLATGIPGTVFYPSTTPQFFGATRPRNIALLACIKY